MALKSSSKFRLYEKTIVEFAAKKDGYFFALSHDQNFVRMLRQLLNKDLVIGMDRIRVVQEEPRLLKEMKALEKVTQGNHKTLVFIERVLHSRSTLPFIKNLKSLYDDIHVVVLTTEVERQVLILLHELG